jgi:hypothetical protein
MNDLEIREWAREAIARNLFQRHISALEFNCHTLGLKHHWEGLSQNIQDGWLREADSILSLKGDGGHIGIILDGAPLPENRWPCATCEVRQCPYYWTDIRGQLRLETGEDDCDSHRYWVDRSEALDDMLAAGWVKELKKEIKPW